MVKPEEKKLNRQQREAVEHGPGPLLVIAGAGTGKTTVVTERIKYLVAKKLARPEEILALTFTDKAAREMEERVDLAMPLGYTQMWISTFHSFCDQILRQEALQIGLDPGYHLMGQAETTQFLRDNLFRFKLNYFRPLGNPNKFVEGMLQHFSRLKDEDVSPEEYLKYAEKLKNKKTKKEERDEAEKTLELAQAYRAYEELKVKEGVADFADLISSALKLFRTRKNVLRRYQEQFKYILVDEFQDTNYAQNELASLLAGEKANLTVSGDDDQSIYRFRGAAVSNIIQFRRNFPKAKIVVLTQNYRSTQKILDRAYALIQNNNPDRLEVKEKVNKKLEAVRKETGEPVEFIFTGRVENEAEAVAGKIVELTTQAGKEVYNFGDIAILVRANDHAEPFIRALARAGIPYQFLGPGQLFRQGEVRDLIAYLGLLNNFEDSTAAFRVLSMDHFDIPARDLAAIVNYARKYQLSLFEAAEKVDQIRVTEAARAHLSAFVKMFHRHLGLLAKETAGQILYYFLEDSGLLAKITQYQTPTQERRAQNLARFFDKLKTYEVEHEDATVPAVVDWIKLSLELGESPRAADIDWTEENRVNLLTVHSAKGLEFPVVFLVNLVVGRFPTVQRREQIPIPEALIKEILPVGDYHLEEERRLFYVGMTRARDRLFVSAARFYGEGKRVRRVSPFVAEALGEMAVREKEEVTGETQLTLADWAKKEEPEPVSAKKPLDYLTYSMIDTFRTCPLHFKLKYLLGLPTPPSAAQSFGSSLHASLRDFYRARILGQRPGERELLAIFAQNWIAEGYLSRRHQELTFKKGQKFMRSFWRQVKGERVLPLALEQPFVLKIGSLKVGGKIDRVDPKKGGGIEIIDYKTGAAVPEQEKVDQDLQLTIYALAANLVPQHPFGQKPDQVSLSFYYFETGDRLTSQRSQEELERAKVDLQEWAKKITQSDYACSGSSLCRDCEYRLFCEVGD